MLVMINKSILELRDPRKLYAYIKPLILQDRMTYIFFDEIQHVTDFPDIINSGVVSFPRKGKLTFNQTGVKDSIAGAELVTKDEAQGIKNQLMTGSYLRPFTVEFTASLKF